MKKSNQIIKFLAVLPEGAKADVQSYNYIISPSSKDAEQFIIGKLKKNKQVTYASFGPNTVTSHKYLVDTFFNIISTFTQAKCSLQFFIQTATLRIPSDEDTFCLVNNQSRLAELIKQLQNISPTDFIKFSIYIDEWSIFLVSFPAFPPFSAPSSEPYRANGWRSFMNPTDFPYFLASPTFAAIHFDISLHYETLALQLLPSEQRVTGFQENTCPSRQVPLPEPAPIPASDLPNSLLPVSDIGSTDNENLSQHSRTARNLNGSQISDQNDRLSHNSQNSQTSPQRSESNLKREVQSEQELGLSPEALQNAKNIIAGTKTPAKELQNRTEIHLEFEEEEDRNASFEADEALAAAEAAAEAQTDNYPNPTQKSQKSQKSQKFPKTQKMQKTQKLYQNQPTAPNFEEEIADAFPYQNENEEEELLMSENSQNSQNEDFGNAGNEIRIEDEVQRFAREQEFTIPALEDTVVFSTLFQQLFHEKWKSGAIVRARAALQSLSEGFKKRCTEDLASAKDLVDSNDPSAFIEREEKRLQLLEQKSVESLNSALKQSVEAFKNAQEQSLLRQFQKICAERLILETSVRESKSKIRMLKLQQTRAQVRRLDALKLNHQHADQIEKGNKAREMIEELAPEHQTMEEELKQLEKDRAALAMQRNKVKAKLEAELRKRQAQN